MSTTDNKIKAYAPNPDRPWWLVWNPETKDWVTSNFLHGALWEIGIEGHETMIICGANVLGDEYDVGVEVPVSISHVTLV